MWVGGGGWVQWASGEWVWRAWGGSGTGLVGEDLLGWAWESPGTTGKKNTCYSRPREHNLTYFHSG